MQLADINPSGPPLSVFVQQDPEQQPGRSEGLLEKWIGDLGDDLMWIGMLGDRREPRCLPNHNRPPGEIRGWSELSKLMELVPSLLELACPSNASGNVVLRTADALYVALCLKGTPRLVLGIEPETSLTRLGFA
jgi:hypothetical protein